MNYDKAIEKLGGITAVLRKVPEQIRVRVTDIRLSVGKPIMLCCGESIYFLRRDGTVGLAADSACVTVSQADMDAVFLRLCNYSVYSHMDEIRNGFVSVDHSLRVGIGGTAVVESGTLRTVRGITSLTVRIPRERIGCADAVLRAAKPEQGILIAGAPSSGKTTLLRDIARTLGNSGRRVVVLDERFELLADGFDLGICTDVLQGYPKPAGLSHAIRCLSPEFILCDELGDDDLPAVQAAAFAGAAITATVHAGSITELCRRPICQKLLMSSIFGYVVLLQGRAFAGRAPVVLKAGDLLENRDDGAAHSLRLCGRAV